MGGWGFGATGIPGGFWVGGSQAVNTSLQYVGSGGVSTIGTVATSGQVQGGTVAATSGFLAQGFTGTTNSAVALADGTSVRLAQFHGNGRTSDTFRSILYFDPKPAPGAESVFAGPSAVEHYRQAAHKGRFLQSLKAYLGDANFTGTVVGGRNRTLPELVSLILRRLMQAASADLGALPTTAASAILPTCATWSACEMPKPTASGSVVCARTRCRKAGSVSGRLVRAPVTPARPTRPMAP